MVLVVEDGSGMATAESYASVALVDSYVTDGFIVGATATDWTGASVALKEAALRRATAYLDGHYGNAWKGTKGSAAQALDWPRFDVKDGDGYAVASNDLPTALEKATAEVAIETVVRSQTLDAVVDDSSGIIREKVVAGSIESDIEYQPAKVGDGTDSASGRFPSVDNLLADLISVGGGRRIPLG